MTITETDRRAAITFGRLAGERGMPVTACPYRARGDARQRALRLLWMRTYVRYNAGA
ncbi:hypothetical protein HII36_05470 [Nonomuraea sp. NN258]|uniref:Rmf/CrpP fold protein n=1 Tax=Nonomuraea antri TaxID=2730852 RepID=UPI001568E9B6|nr:Rmf/CrpP fold protein [Nonomuraea antri]NRQ31287.1 hypothetical protein [Nonomuraea antri]